MKLRTQKALALRLIVFSKTLYSFFYFLQHQRLLYIEFWRKWSLWIPYALWEDWG